MNGIVEENSTCALCDNPVRCCGLYRTTSDDLNILDYQAYLNCPYTDSESEPDIVKRHGKQLRSNMILVLIRERPGITISSSFYMEDNYRCIIERRLS